MQLRGELEAAKSEDYSQRKDEGEDADEKEVYDDNKEGRDTALQNGCQSFSPVEDIRENMSVAP